MRHDEALELIRGAVAPGGVWADLGAGTGTFTRALGELVGPDGTIWAVDRGEEAVRALHRLELAGGEMLHVLEADFTRPLELPTLDGILMANALHFVRDQESALRRIVSHLRPGGRLVLVEYDRRRGNPWVPHPIPPARFQALAAAVGLSSPREVGRRRSSYGREMYAAAARRPQEPGSPA
jgi:ubiquinone/menaquinone biosynthesis C-methylase UbiE